MSAYLFIGLLAVCVTAVIFYDYARLKPWLFEWASRRERVCKICGRVHRKTETDENYRTLWLIDGPCTPNTCECQLYADGFSGSKHTYQ